MSTNIEPAQPCRGDTALNSCTTVDEIRGLTSSNMPGGRPFRFVPEAAETCQICGHIRARRVRTPNAQPTGAAS